MTVFQKRLARMSHRERGLLTQAMGVQRSTVYRWRTGESLPERGLALRLVEYFQGEISLEDIYRTGHGHGHD